MKVSTEAEAAYLVAVLNAEVLQPAFRATRRSDRDFHTHFWYEVPIPRYEDHVGLHRKLAALGRQIEEAAGTVRDEPPLRGAGQVKVCSEIRANLGRTGLSGRIDEGVRELLRYQST